MNVEKLSFQWITITFDSPLDTTMEDMTIIAWLSNMMREQTLKIAMF